MNQTPDDSDPHDDRHWMKFAALGMELAGITIGCLAIGIVIDRMMDLSTPYASALGALIGFSFGMFRFIQKVST